MKTWSVFSKGESKWGTATRRISKNTNVHNIPIVVWTGWFSISAFFFFSFLTWPISLPRELHTILQSAAYTQGDNHGHFEGGVKLGVGAFNLVRRCLHTCVMINDFPHQTINKGIAEGIPESNKVEPQCKKKKTNTCHPYFFCEAQRPHVEPIFKYLHFILGSGGRALHY